MKNFIIFILSLTLVLYVTENPVKDYIICKNDYDIEDIEIYKYTSAWDLAKFVEAQETEKIKLEIEKHPKLLNYQDPKYGATLLMWSVGMEKYESARTLLECGADPNIQTEYNGATPLYVASGYSWIDSLARKDAKYVKLLLKYGADPNIVYRGTGKNDGAVGASPLINSIGTGIGKTKALVEAGADINYKDESGMTAAIAALIEEVPRYAYYLIVENHASITEPKDSSCSCEPNKKYYPVFYLRFWVLDLDSREYQIKLKIIDEFKSQGVDYWDEPIPDGLLDDIKERYPKTWKEYIEMY